MVTFTSYLYYIYTTGSTIYYHCLFPNGWYYNKKKLFLKLCFWLLLIDYFNIYLEKKTYQ